MLRFENVSFGYEREKEIIPLIEKLSFHVHKGEFVSVIGPSGCGKSTLFRLVNQLIKADAGEIYVAGENISGRKGYCGYMPQSDMLFDWRTIGENVTLPIEISGERSKAERRTEAERVLKMVGLLEWIDRYPKELSGGMRQRAAFARTLLTGNELLLLDEPFSALDYLTRVSMREWLLEQWQEDRKTILFITHDVEEAIYLSDRILIIEDGPIKKLAEVKVPAEYPRTREVMHKKEIIELKDELIDRLRRRSR